MSHSHSSSNSGWSLERLGFALCVASTAFYCGSNVSMRCLTDYSVPHAWVLFYKELVCLTPLLPWLLIRLFQGRYARQSKRLIAWVVVGGVVGQFVGARLQIWSFSTIGLVLSMPIIYAFTIVGSTLLGRVMVRDPISRRRLQAIGFLIVALSVLTLGKMSIAATNTGTTQSQWLSLMGICGAMVAGLSCAFYLTCLRLACSRHWQRHDSFWDNLRWNAWRDRQQQHGEPMSLVLAVALVLVIGIAIFGGCLYQGHGLSGFLCNDPRCWWLVVTAGTCNFFGFMLQALALRVTSAAQVSLVSVLQLVMVTIIGRFVFTEEINALILVGLALTMVGVFISSRSS